MDLYTDWGVQNRINGKWIALKTEWKVTNNFCVRAHTPSHMPNVLYAMDYKWLPVAN